MKACIARSSFPKDDQSSSHVSVAVFAQFILHVVIHCSMAENLVRQNYHTDSEEGVNKQINLELFAFHTYLSMVRWPLPS